MSDDSSVFRIEEWCARQTVWDWNDNSHHPSSTVQFLQQLDLPSMHPFCQPPTAISSYVLPGIPPQGPLLSQDHLETYQDVIVTVIAMGVPALWAMLELWLRLFAYFLAPLGVAHLLYVQLFNNSGNEKEQSSGSVSTTLTCLVSTLSCIILATDALYVHEFDGPQYGLTLTLICFTLSWRAASRHPSWVIQPALIGLLLILIGLVYNPQEPGSFSFGGRADDLAQIEEGLYYHTQSAFAQAVVQAWPKHYYTYSLEGGATPWFPTGDSRTGLPFLLNKVSNPTFQRVWLPLDDGEVVALDMAFPPAGHDPTQPLYLVLHGLNGGSQEEYVQDFVHRRNAEQATVVVMIARGLMDLPIRGMNNFHGARWKDPHQAAQALRRAKAPNQLLAGVGYSMGAIILGNMVARTGSECALDVAISISGGLDMRHEIDFARAQRLWQPMLTAELRDTFVVGKWGERVRSRLTKEQMKLLMRATHVSEIDKTAVVAYNGYRDLVHYYSDMSVLGDVPYPSDEYAGEALPLSRRIHNISIPFCVVHSLDDPLVTWRTVAANEGLMHPTNLTNGLDTSHLYMVLTKRGGHVGWPLGWLPFVDKWKWMSDISMGFVHAVSQARSSVAAGE